MFDKAQAIISHPRVKQLSDVRNIGLYFFGLLVLAITWSGVKTIQDNYKLQKKISVLQQQNDVQRLENETLKLKNQYLETDQYLEIAARRQFGKAAPGETVYIVPKSVAMKYVAPISETDVATAKQEKQYEGWRKNWHEWWNFLAGKQDSE